jgi:hypothetical protein
MQTAVIDRLERLDTELTTTKHFDYLYVVRRALDRDMRFKVCVMVDGERFVATTKVGDRVHRGFGPKPSHAVIKLTETMKWAVAKLAVQQNQRMVS